MQTVITTWLQYGNSTRFPANSTTITVQNVTNPVGWYSWSITTVSTVWPSLTTVILPTTTMTQAIGGPTFVYDYITNSTMFIGVPNTLLPTNAQMYASSQVLQATTMVYELQGMTFTSPTPWLWYSQVYVGISQACNATTPGLPAIERPIMATSTVVQSIPNQDGTGFTFSQYMEDRNMTKEGDGSSLYQFALPEDLPALLAGIPEVVASWPNIGTCTNMMGQGEPTVHIPVSQLTVMSDVTITMKNTITSAEQMPTTTAGGQPSPSAASIVTADQPAPTTPGASKESDQVSSAGGAQQTDDATKDDSAGEGSPPGTGGSISAISCAVETDALPSTSSASIGDIIASVIGLVPSPASTAAQPVQTSEIDTPATAAVAPVPVIVGGSIVTADASGNFEIGGQTLLPGSAITVGGNTISVDTSATEVIINGATMPIATVIPDVTIGDSVLTPGSDGAFELGTQTLQPGSTMVIDGTILSLAPSGTAIVVDGSTTPVAAPVAVITLPGATLSANTDGSLNLAGQTLQPGSAITVVGSTFSLASDGNAIAVNGQTTPITAAAAAAASPSLLRANQASPSPASMTITVNPEDEYIIGSQTLHPGGSALTVSGTLYSLASDGNNLFINGQAFSIGSSAAASVTIADNTNQDGDLLFNTQTLHPGASALTVSGKTFSLGTDPFLIGSQTLSLEQQGGYGIVVIDGNPLSLMKSSQGLVVSGTRTSTLDVVSTTTRAGSIEASASVTGVREEGAEGAGMAESSASVASGGVGRRVGRGDVVVLLCVVLVGFYGTWC